MGTADILRSAQQSFLPPHYCSVYTPTASHLFERLFL
jgi:hypothetical protein